MFKSVAQWPESVCLGNSDNTSVDSHSTLSAASIICDRLRTQGFGGCREIFPIEVWVEDEDGTKISVDSEHAARAARLEEREAEARKSKWGEMQCMLSSMGWDMPKFKTRNPSSADIRSNPNRVKTDEDIEKINAAKAKRARKAKK